MTDKVTQIGVKKATMSFRRINLITDKPKPHDWLIKGLIERNSVGLVFGKPASGKSFLVMDWAFCVAAGIDWDGKPTKQCDVFYVAGEGFAGMARRFKALELKYDKVVDNIFMSEMPTELMSSVAMAELANVIQGTSENPALIIFDTVHRNFGGGDENSSKDFGIVMNNVDMFLKPINATVLFVHHSGHSQTERIRGSSAIQGSLDIEYKVSKDAEGIIEVANTKAKEIMPPPPMNFKMVQQDLGWIDEDGNSITSVILESTEATIADTPKIRTLNGNNQVILEALSRVISQNGIKPNIEITARFGGFEHGARVCTRELWREEAFKVIDAKNDGAKKTAFSRAIKILLKNHIRNYDNYYWIINT